MHDCLVLAKKYRRCLGGYSLEFPLVDELGLPQPTGGQETNGSALGEAQPAQCNRRRLISRFIDGDALVSYGQIGDLAATTTTAPEQTNKIATILADSQLANVATDYDGEVDVDVDANKDNEPTRPQLMHVPINGLLDRLKNYTNIGLAVDSRVYAFAMGLKTSERFLTTNFERELHESPL